MGKIKTIRNSKKYLDIFLSKIFLSLSSLFPDFIGFLKEINII